MVFKKGNTFKSNVMVLMTGTVAAQLIPLLASPVLSRIYTPSDFGLLALYTALASIIGTIATLRYELAIVQPKNDKDAAALVWISIVALSIIIFLTIITSFLYNYFNFNFLGVDSIRSWLYLLPVSVLAIGTFQIFNKWLLRHGSYPVMSKSAMFQSGTSSSTQLLFGLSTYNGGLVYGQLCGQLISSIYVVKRSLKISKLPSFRKCKDKLSLNIKNYKRMPLYSSAGALADILSIQMPVLMITRFFLESAVGAFSLTFRVLNIPAAIISTALAQVLYKKINDIHNDNGNGISRFIIKIFLSNLALITPFVLVFYFFGEELFVFVFGVNWREAGQMASVLTFAAAIRFVVSPLSGVLALEKNIRLGASWQFLYLFTLFAILYSFRSSSIDSFIIAFVIHELVQYLIYFGLILKGARRLERMS